MRLTGANLSKANADGERRMKLRNKKTGDIWDFDGGFTMKASHDTAERAGAGSGVLTCYAHSIAELNENWEDAEPLIKDEKVRKVVRAWADTNNVDKVEYNTYSTGDCSFVFTYDDGEELLLDFRYKIDNLISGKKYTIAELCGEEEE